MVTSNIHFQVYGQVFRSYQNRSDPYPSTSPGPARAGRVCRAAQGDSGAPATRGQIWGRLVT